MTQKRETQTTYGAITLVRHGEPALRRRVWLDAKGFGDWWARYEEGGLLKGQMPPRCLDAHVKNAAHIFSSTRLRAIETAQAICQGRAFERHEMFIEAPLPAPPLPSFIKLRPTSHQWGTISRLFWYYFNYHAGQETRFQAEARAIEAADFLLEKAKDGEVLLLAHGFFNYMISRELKKRGYRKTLEQGFKYWGCRRYELKAGLLAPQEATKAK